MTEPSEYECMQPGCDFVGTKDACTGHAAKTPGHEDFSSVPSWAELGVEAECDRLCVWGADIGVPTGGVAYPHPGCPAHDPGRECQCGQPDRCLSPTHGQITYGEALTIRHAQRKGR